MQYRERTGTFLLGLASCLLFATGGTGCDDSTESNRGDGGDTGETDTGSELDSESDSGVGTCIGTIVGEIKTDKGENWQGRLSICIPACVALETDKAGKFSLQVGTPCTRYDFEGSSAPLHLTILDNSGGYAAYGAAYTPGQEAVSDKGADDYEYDLGTLVLYELPAEKVDYSAEDGASVDVSGVSFHLPAKSLVGREWDQDATDFVDVPAETAEIRVFEAPLDGWKPPFDTVGLDALYFIAPRWAKLAGEGVSLSIAPPDGWSEGDTGTLYILADDVGGLGTMPEYIVGNDSGECLTSVDVLDKEPGGELADCGVAEMKDGRVITPPIPRLSWIGLKK